MNRYFINILTPIFFSLLPLLSHAMGEDDPLLGKIIIDQFEARDSSNPGHQIWDGKAWVGKDLNKIWLKSQGEFAHQEIEGFEVSLLYGKAISPHWEFMLGLKTDFKPHEQKSWLEIGLQGLSPYFLHINTSLFIDEEANSGLRFESEYELMLTQKWILSPQIEVDLFAQNDQKWNNGSGLSHVDTGLRLAYQLRRELSPYLGVNFEKNYGKTAEFVSDSNNHDTGSTFVLGIKAWL